MLSPIQLLYYAWDISHKKSVSDDSRFTGVLSEARVDLNPHQVEAALFAFKSPLSRGAILADELLQLKASSTERSFSEESQIS